MGTFVSWWCNHLFPNGNTKRVHCNVYFVCVLSDPCSTVLSDPCFVYFPGSTFWSVPVQPVCCTAEGPYITTDGILSWSIVFCLFLCVFLSCLFVYTMAFGQCWLCLFFGPRLFWGFFVIAVRVLLEVLSWNVYPFVKRVSSGPWLLSTIGWTLSGILVRVLLSVKICNF